ncbi:nicotinate-nucleotide adenylyltransferase [Caldisericum exile]|uniref:Probable nicotinate-nucleotide adenylyltransferase n=1 Tax=Caldisericum exile (strain DSM 21853 / NBRC 104410 / AZM16c01) TaxID=511051 RepID=A0A7U6GFJ7_CALEA|nr:nicotinate-nucleotide adenylyltransferase [Caldisericum exile]BAL81488.1 putative nicotinate-nucleotide adenylyltransferase [Caldisericum exile AZM16c01]
MEANLSSTTKIRIALYGGAFNPIHVGHLFVAKEAINLFNLSKVIFIPTGNPVFAKKDLLDKYIRLNLVKMAIKDENHFEVSDFEVKSPEPSYYIETLKHFKQEGVEIFSIIGEDAFLKITLWKDYEEILRNSYFIVAKRLNDDFSTLREFISENLNGFKDKIFTLSHPLFCISSTLIRERVKNGLSITYLVPKEVELEILRNNYYKRLNSFG